MPPHTWATDPVTLVQSFEARHAQPEAGALLVWAARSVDCLHYLDDVDREYDGSRTVTGGHRPDIVDIAHVRWATGTAITALDLCAAGLGRTFCGQASGRELALPDFDPSPSVNQMRRVTALRAALPATARQWVDNVHADARYSEIKIARNWLTHSRVKRHFTMAAGGVDPRLRIELGTRQFDIRQVVEDARDLATLRVSELLMMLPQL